VHRAGTGVRGHDQAIGERGIFQTSSGSDDQSMYSWYNSSEENSCIRTWRYGYYKPRSMGLEHGSMGVRGVLGLVHMYTAICGKL